MKRIGIFGGSFDPVHWGHLLLAEQAAEAAGLEYVIFMPTRVSPFKIGTAATPPEHRLRMVELAVESNPRFTVSGMEIETNSVSYSIDTLDRLRARLGEGYELYFIMGGDSLLSLESWYHADRLLREYAFVAAVRPGHREEELEQVVTHYRLEYGTKVVKALMPPVAISSTDVRNRLSQGRSLRYILPESVRNYIKQEGLYR